jgi:hypothetical protein
VEIDDRVKSRTTSHKIGGVGMDYTWLIAANDEILSRIAGVTWYFLLVLVNLNKYTNKPALHIVGMRRSQGENTQAYSIRERKESRAYTKAYLLPLILVFCGFLFKISAFILTTVGIDIGLFEVAKIFMNTWLALLLPIVIMVLSIIFELYMASTLFGNGNNA